MLQLFLILIMLSALVVFAVQPKAKSSSKMQLAEVRVTKALPIKTLIQNRNS